MSIWIDERACVGCGRCREVCPGGLIRQDGSGPASIVRPRDCWGCTACVKACPTDAIAYFLGADMGGRGTRLKVSSTAGANVWTFVGPDGSELEITTDRTKANKY